MVKHNQLFAFRLITVPDEKPEVERMIFALNENGKLFTSYLSNLSHKDKPVKFLVIDQGSWRENLFDFKKSNKTYHLKTKNIDEQVKIVMTHEELLESEVDSTPPGSKIKWSKQILLPDIQNILDRDGYFLLEMKSSHFTNEEYEEYFNSMHTFKYVPHLVEGRYIIHTTVKENNEL